MQSQVIHHHDDPWKTSSLRAPSLIYGFFLIGRRLVIILELPLKIRFILPFRIAISLKNGKESLFSLFWMACCRL